MLISKQLTRFAIMLLLTLFVCSCSTRGIHDQYFGATEQRLLARSIDKLMLSLPEEDFKPLTGKQIQLVCHFVENNTALQYAKDRLELELREKYQAGIVKGSEDADAIIQVFFTALGTDQDDFGLKTPEFIMPGSASTVSINLITLDMYHGVSELYYYIIDQKNPKITRSERIKATIRTDKLALPIISIPINTLD